MVFFIDFGAYHNAKTYKKQNKLAEEGIEPWFFGTVVDSFDFHSLPTWLGFEKCTQVLKLGQEKCTQGIKLVTQISWVKSLKNENRKRNQNHSTRCIR